MRTLIFCLMLASVPVFGGPGFELWLEGLQTGNKITHFGSGKRDTINTQWIYVRALWTFRQDGSGFTISCGINLTDSYWEITSGSIIGQGVTYTQTMNVHYEPRYFFGLHYRTPGKTAFSLGADIRNSRTTLEGGHTWNHSETSPSWELAPSIQIARNVYKQINLGVKLGYRLQFKNNNNRADWFDERQNHPEFAIVAGWKFGRLLS